jgi:hypothetical protein
VFSFSSVVFGVVACIGAMFTAVLKPLEPGKGFVTRLALIASAVNDEVIPSSSSAVCSTLLLSLSTAFETPSWVG